MNNGIKLVFTFALGATAGSVVAWKILKNKYEQIAQEEIDSVKEVYSRKLERYTQPTESADQSCENTENNNDENITNQYTTIVNNYNGSDEKEKKGGSEPMENTRPYVIPPEELGEKDGYEVITLIYFEDGVVTDEDYEPVKEVDYLIGEESLTHFGEYEPDSVCVRSDDLECDYEIIADARNFRDLNLTSDN